MIFMQAEPTPGTVAVHHQIADSIRERIASGDLQPGDAIPTIEELRTQWQCSPGTARSALAVLRGEGLITQGRGRAARVRRPPSRIKLPQAFGQRQKDAVLLPEGERSASGAIELTSGCPDRKDYRDLPLLNSVSRRADRGRIRRACWHSTTPA